MSSRPDESSAEEQRERLETEAERVKAWLRAKREEIRGQGKEKCIDGIGYVIET